MRAFILAAGLGQRLRPFTEETPKPLLEVGGRPLIAWHIEKLRQAGITDLVINSHWLADKLTNYLGDGSVFGVDINWSHESDLLNIGGGIYTALPILGNQPFALISADIWSDFDYSWLVNAQLEESVARLVMVPSPEFAPEGDFTLDGKGRLALPGNPGARVTYSGIGLVNPAWVAGWSPDARAFPWIGPLREAVQQGSVTAELHEGRWTDVGTAERLDQLRGEIG